VRSPAARIAVAIGTVVVLVVLFLVLRGSNDEEAASASTSSTTTTRAAEPTTTAPTTTARATTASPANAVRIEIAVKGGNVFASRPPEVKKGDRVELIVSADVSDEVHVHGYDLMKDVAPGAPARISFRATIVGRFEVELEDRKLQILEFEVRP
jgi:FtsP/CotA-like multicopper oxidase with cupredoxin domain